MRIGLFGRLGSGNIGNDATLEAVLAYLKAERPDAVLDSLCSGPKRVTERYGVPAAQLGWLDGVGPVRGPKPIRLALTLGRIVAGSLIDTWRIMSWVRRHDVVIVPGMGVLESTLPQRPWELPWTQFVMSLSGKLFGVKVAFVSVGANVVRERATGWLLARSAKLAYYRSFRDEQSLGAAQKMRMAGQSDHVYPDLVFALPSPPIAPAGDSVGVGVMAYSGGTEERADAERIQEEYTAQMTQFVERLLADGRRVRLLIGDEADEVVALDVQSRVQSAHVVYEPFTSADELMNQLGTVDTVIGTRFHTVLFGLKLGKPTIAIGYGRKHLALMEQLGVAEWFQDIRELDAERLYTQFVALQGERAQVVRTIHERLQVMRERLDEQFAELTAVLFGGRS
ncbi:polysaccharide pyruvyl transferase family protein [Kribbella albertanoniae]|uniref:polysaccharide pyruvyl transferase family protein n=1 Tax=Kribbella albertanoniae TaxID=1266829 RepID=UPI0014046346|nr:polysaccharide pyruvyl transferase family protein [Kribbella albertanoniae]